ncbi:hypothetical protein OSTOST_01947 [Ostertagia ostertagi]
MQTGYEFLLKTLGYYYEHEPLRTNTSLLFLTRLRRQSKAPNSANFMKRIFLEERPSHHRKGIPAEKLLPKQDSDLAVPAKQRKQEFDEDCCTHFKQSPAKGDEFSSESSLSQHISLPGTISMGVECASRPTTPTNNNSVLSEAYPVGTCNCGSIGAQSPVRLRWNLRPCSVRPLSDVYPYGFTLHTFYSPQEKKFYSLDIRSHSVDDLSNTNFTTHNDAKRTCLSDGYLSSSYSSSTLYYFAKGMATPMSSSSSSHSRSPDVTAKDSNNNELQDSMKIMKWSIDSLEENSGFKCSTSIDRASIDSDDHI